MRLIELLNEYNIKTGDLPTGSYAHPTKDRLTHKNDDTEHLGSGKFSDVYSTASNPHDVMKMTKDKLATTDKFEDDGYTAFIKALSNDKEMQDNIHMPRIRSVRMNSRGDFQIRIERLEPLTNLSLREAYDLIKKYWPTSNILQELKDEIYLYKTTKDPNMAKHRYLRMVNNAPYEIAYLVKETEAGNRTTTDDEFNNALFWIYGACDKYGFYPDLHTDNIMIRRNQYGITLVMSDPIGLKRFKRFKRPDLNESTSTYKEIEFVCTNPNYAHATKREAQSRFFGILKEIPNLLPYMQDFNDIEEGQRSLAVIILDHTREKELTKLVHKLAKQHNISIDIEHRVSNTLVDKVINGSLEHIVENIENNRETQGVLDLSKKGQKTDYHPCRKGPPLYPKIGANSGRTLVEYEVKSGKLPKPLKRHIDAAYSAEPSDPHQVKGDEKTTGIGAGSYSIAMRHEDNPHDVMKMSRPRQTKKNKEDGYIVFVKALADDKTMQDNIHMPHIRSLRVASDGETYQARIESLEHIESASSREIYNAIQQYFPKHGAECLAKAKLKFAKISEREPGSARDEMYSWVHDDLTNNFAYLIERIGTNPKFNSTSDDLNAAVHWVYALSKETKFELDLHQDNIMIRRGPYGIVPVINDPLSYYNK